LRPGLAFGPSLSIELRASSPAKGSGRAGAAERVNDKIRARNKQETGSPGVVLINPDKLSGMEKNRNYSAKMEKSELKGE